MRPSSRSRRLTGRACGGCRTTCRTCSSLRRPTISSRSRRSRRALPTQRSRLRVCVRRLETGPAAGDQPAVPAEDASRAAPERLSLEDGELLIGGAAPGRRCRASAASRHRRVGAENRDSHRRFEEPGPRRCATSAWDPAVALSVRIALVSRALSRVTGYEARGRARRWATRRAGIRGAARRGGLDGGRDRG